MTVKAVLRRLAAGVEQPQSEKVKMTAKDTSTVDGTYGSEEENVIKNNRTRIEELETAVRKLGVLD